MLKQEILNQAMELYKLGIEVETERQCLSDYAERYGLSEPRTVEQAEKVQGLLNKFAELEKKHLAATERHMCFKRMGIR